VPYQPRRFAGDMAEPHAVFRQSVLFMRHRCAERYSG
jgi:hypothetical protein